MSPIEPSFERNLAFHFHHSTKLYSMRLLIIYITHSIFSSKRRCVVATRALLLPTEFLKSSYEVPRLCQHFVLAVDRFIRLHRYMFCSAQQSGSSFYFSFYCNVPFELNSQENCKCHSSWELANFMSFPATTSTVVVYVICIYVLFDQKMRLQLSLVVRVIFSPVYLMEQ